MLRQAKKTLIDHVAYAQLKISGVNITRTYRRKKKRKAIVAARLRQRISAQITLTFTKSSGGRLHRR